MNTSLRVILCAASVAAILSACAPATPSPQAIQTAIAQTQSATTQTATGMSGEFASRLNKLVEEGSTLTAMTVQGITFSEFRQQLARAKGAYGVALSAQTGAGPTKEIGSEAIDALNQAFTGWDLALSVWDAKQSGSGAPHAPDAVRYAALVEYVGLEKLPFVGGVPGEGDVDADQAIRLLLSMATDHWGKAQDLLIATMQ